MNETMNTEEAAKYLKVSMSTLANLRSKGEAPKSYNPTGGRVIYYKSDLDKWIKTRRDVK